MIRQGVLFFLFLLSCNSNKNAALKNLFSLYDGKFILENKKVNGLAAGTEKFLKLTSAKNSLVEEGWLLPNSMANNCAIVLFRSNSLLFEGKNFLEVEIDINNTDPYVFKYTAYQLKEMVKIYDSVEAVIKNLVQNTIAKNKTKVKSVGYIMGNQQDVNFDSFFEALSNAIPENYKDTQLVSFSANNTGQAIEYLVDALLITQDNLQKMINVKLITANSEIKIKEVKF